MTYVTTKERRANLVKLARFLYTEPIEPKRFGMSCFFKLDDDYDAGDETVKVQSCNTAGCAVGWGPMAGIPFDEDEAWIDYCSRQFICSSEESYQWEWCFDANWIDGDNTPKGAAKRILWLLLHGLPKNDYLQRVGAEPLCYADWTPTEADWQLAAQEPAE
jgi:hypothetical protein